MLSTVHWTLKKMNWKKVGRFFFLRLRRKFLIFFSRPSLLLFFLLHRFQFRRSIILAPFVVLETYQANQFRTENLGLAKQMKLLNQLSLGPRAWDMGSRAVPPVSKLVTAIPSIHCPWIKTSDHSKMLVLAFRCTGRSKSCQLGHEEDFPQLRLKLSKTG